jgi:Tfp pilus assembly protein PilO
VKRRVSPRTLGVIVGVLVLAYAAGGYFLLVGPKKGEASKLDGEIATATAELESARAAAAVVPDDTQPIAVADVFRLAAAMPSTPDMPGILLELSRIAEETGIRFTSITPQEPVPVGEYYEVPVDVMLDGTFYALSDFLFRMRTLVGVRRGELHASGRLFSISSLDFAESSDGFPALTASLKVKAYVYGTDTGAAAVPPPAEPAEGAETTEGAEVPPPPGSEAAPTEATGTEAP